MSFLGIPSASWRSVGCVSVSKSEAGDEGEISRVEALRMSIWYLGRMFTFGVCGISVSRASRNCGCRFAIYRSMRRPATGLAKLQYLPQLRSQFGFESHLIELQGLDTPISALDNSLLKSVSSMFSRQRRHVSFFQAVLVSWLL